MNASFTDWLAFRTFNDPALETLVRDCAAWTSAFRSGAPPRWLTILGKSGTGKTHCAERLWAWSSARSDFSRAEYPHRKIYWPRLLQDLRAGDAFKLRTDLQSWPVLFVDDIGAARDPSGFAAEELNTLLGCRFGRWTILTSNLRLADFSAIDPRISSRLVRPPNICCQVNTTDFASRQPTTPP